MRSWMLLFIVLLFSCSNPFAAEDKTLIFESLTASQEGITRVWKIEAVVIQENINHVLYTFSYGIPPKYGAYFVDVNDSTITTSLNTTRFLTEKRSGVRTYVIHCMVIGDNITRSKSVTFEN